MLRALVLVMLMVSGCNKDETLAAFAGDAGDFTLISIDSLPFDGRATINIRETGRISGQAPCNRYFATQTAPYPWFEIGPIGATRMACADLALEQTFFDNISKMTLTEISGGTLILSNTDGLRMIFQVP